MVMELTFFNVLHGNTTSIKTDTLNILYDCGTVTKLSKYYFNPFSYFKYSDKQIDYLILSHPHKDHINRIINITKDNMPKCLSLNQKIPKELIEEQIEYSNKEDKEIYKKYLELDSIYNSRVTPNCSPLNYNYNGHVEIQNFEPEKNDIKDLNYYSITTFLKYQDYSILLTGDNTLENINELLNNKSFLEKTENIDILLAPHHGRKSCYHQEFIKHLNPRITIISDYKNNNNESAVNQYSENSRGYEIDINGIKKIRKCLTTRNDGSIKIKIENKKLKIYCGVKI
ncbi:ComEC/Rec2 family competence protein [Methanobrevibacter woesei]|uniref:ComEC/Rec2 family competence protein n=1 Tax=Methanobrevibacter woesei TaxID=190976 RepID=UPI00255B5B1B|nr:MBL fold metallo-hydrolase [Methanobrevibacter woesei]